MYHRVYGMREAPFELTPNPRFLFMTPRHREALSNLQYGLSAPKSLTVLIAEAGTGKTTLLRAALESEACRHVRCVYLNNPALTRDDFVKTLAARFELSAEAASSKAVLLDELERDLRARRTESGEISALVVDEAQALSLELLEELRLLANIETSTERLLPLVLAGQPEFGARLDDPALRQLKQRVALRCEISPFDLPETAAYVASRIRTAGGDASRLFTKEAITLIHTHSEGIPRTISVICDNALVSAMAAGKQTVDKAIVFEVCRDFCLRPQDVQDEWTPPGDETAPDEDAAAPQPAAAVADEFDRGPTMFQSASKPRRFWPFGWGSRNASGKRSEVMVE